MRKSRCLGSVAVPSGRCRKGSTSSKMGSTEKDGLHRRWLRKIAKCLQDHGFGDANANLRPTFGALFIRRPTASQTTKQTSQLRLILRRIVIDQSFEVARHRTCVCPQRLGITVVNDAILHPGWGAVVDQIHDGDNFQLVHEIVYGLVDTGPVVDSRQGSALYQGTL